MYTSLNVSRRNGLKKNIEELLEWLDQMDKDEELGRTYFKEGISEKVLTYWEKLHGAKIPESYRDWLIFSKECLIDDTVASFYGPDSFHPNYVPDDLIVIGTMVGDGTVACFSKTSGKFVEFYNGEISETYDDFTGLLKEILMLLGKKEEKKKEFSFKQLFHSTEESEKKKENTTIDPKTMTVKDFYDVYDSYTIENMTNQFNAFSVEDRKVFLGYLNDKQKRDFVKCISSQAVKNFWTHERELIRNGECTRNWTPEQIEDIMNISETTGKARKNGGVPRC